MCGICGIVAREPVSGRVLHAMAASLVSRGPDDEGYYLGQNAGLGHRRLSIIDLSGGRQPIANEDETLWIILNGEIYNYRTLRDELEKQGHRFRTDSDTETILHLFEEHGTDCVRRLRGMFAFAIWDTKKKRLFAARDHLGQKPFFYAEKPGRFLFGSEIKALLTADSSFGQMNLQALDQYLTLRIIAPPLTMFRGIRKLPPAHWLTFDLNRGLHIQRYWDIRYEPKLEGSDDELVEELERRLVDCLRLHLVSDVPVGAYMSGGLDSTLVVAMLMANNLTDELQTFSVGLPYQQYDEAPYARLVAEKYGTRHREKTITPSLLNTLPQLVWHLDEPSDPLAVCQYLISETASQHVKVVLGGDGGDELFGGYDRYYGNRYADYYSHVPHFLRKYAVGPALGLLPDGRWYKSKSHQLKWMHQLSFHRGGARYAKSLGYFYFRQNMRQGLYGTEMGRVTQEFDPEEAIREPYDRVVADDMLDRMLYADSCVRLPDHPVMILDRMTMAHGLEARAPFMDHELAEFAARLPVRMKVRGRCTRYIQRRLCEKYLPPQLLTRPKQGFQSALPYMLKNEYRLLFDVFLRESRMARDGILRQEAIDDMLRQHLIGGADHGNRLWLLLNSETWYRMFIEGQTREELSSEIQRGVAESEPAIEDAVVCG